MIRRLWLRWLCFANEVCYKHGVAKEIGADYGGSWFLCPLCDKEQETISFKNFGQKRTIAKWQNEFEKGKY